jgi:hypothetical protein
MYCWKCGLRHPDTAITCPRCGAANAPGQGSATPPTVGSRRARELESAYTGQHRVGRHVPGGLSLGIVLVVFVLVMAVLNLIFGR